MLRNLDETPQKQDGVRPEAAWLPLDSACGKLIAERDWSDSLGPFSDWPRSLRTALGMVLQSPVPMVMLWGVDGIMLYNDAYSEFAGGRHPELLGSKVREGWPEVADFNDHVMKVGLAGGTLSYKDQELTLHRNGRPELVSMNLDYSPVPGESGRPAGVLAIVIETTERLRAERLQAQVEAELIAERDRSRGVLENMAEGFVLLDRDFRVVDINTEGLRLEQRPAAEIIGKSHWEAWPGTRESELGRLYIKAMAEGRPITFEQEYVWPDGHSYWIETRAYPTTHGLAIFYRNVSERKSAELALKEAAESVAKEAAERAAILGQLVEGVIIADPEGRITFVNHAAKQLHGVDALDVAPANYSETYHLFREDGSPYPPEDLPLTQAVRHGETVLDARWLIRRPDGTEVVAIGSARPILNGAGRQIGSVLTIRDDTDRSAAEEALRKRGEEFYTLADNLPLLCWMAYADGHIFWYNRRWYEYTGTSAEEQEGWGWESVHDPEHLPEVAKRWQHSLDTGTPFEMVFPLKGRDGTFRSFLTRVVPVRNESGVILRWFGTNTDVTGQLDTEAALAEALQAKDVLLHEVNHRVKNSLQIVTGLLMLQAAQAGDPQLRQSLLEARGRIAVVAAMHQRLYSTSQHDRVDFGDYVRDLTNEALASLGGEDRIVLDCQLEAGIMVLLQQAVPLALVVSELVTNAVKYAFPGERRGTLRLFLQRTGETIVLEVGDDGIGLPEDFDPAKRKGLGMRIVTSLVKQVRGTLEVGEQQPGALFRIVIPAKQID